MSRHAPLMPSSLPSPHFLHPSPTVLPIVFVRLKVNTMSIAGPRDASSDLCPPPLASFLSTYRPIDAPQWGEPWKFGSICLLLWSGREGSDGGRERRRHDKRARERRRELGDSKRHADDTGLGQTK
ncbi:unnamed protein product [Pleuronectes platessa]|uniref:Uncharacterized protein n=1 Tax=Pleuronectes platessa TaxID=8262 RepID=A0A9N7VYD9_PLEPL|nr:unnamed protein product [Pleuronectes platessa]